MAEEIRRGEEAPARDARKLPDDALSGVAGGGVLYAYRKDSLINMRNSGAGSIVQVKDETRGNPVGLIGLQN